MLLRVHGLLSLCKVIIILQSLAVKTLANIISFFHHFLKGGILCTFYHQILFYNTLLAVVTNYAIPHR